MKNVHHRASNAWRVASAFVSLGLLAWGLAAVGYVNSTHASAEENPRFHDIDVFMLVPQGGQWYTVGVEMLVLDSGDGTFEEDVEKARTEMVHRFPGAIEVPEDSMHAAYVLSGFKWMSNSASWGYDGTGAPAGVSASAMSTLQAAASTWGQQGANFQFQGGGPSSLGTGACGGGGTNGSNTVGWGVQSGAVLAVTCSWFENTGSPRAAIEFDMQFDPGWSWTTGGATQVDLQSVALHEFGHAAGLNHSADSSAVMYASYTSGSVKQTPAQDDISGLIAVYGAVGGGSPTSTPTNTPPAATSTPTRTPTPANTPTNIPTTPAGGGQNTPTQPAATSTPTRTPTQPPSSGGSTATPVPPTNPPTRTPTTGPGVPTATNSPSATPTLAAAGATPTSPSGNSLPIRPGANLMAWPGNDMAPAQALAAVQNLKVVYSYDAATGSWTRYIPGGPAFLNNLTSLKKGGSYWFIATGSAQIPFQP